jgi:plastocyanin
MRIKTLGVFSMMVMALFTAVYWLTDAPRRDANFEALQTELVELGMEYFGPDNITYTVTLSPSGFEPASVEIEVNATIQFTNTLDSDVTVTGTGSHPFSTVVKAGANAATRFQSDGVTTASRSWPAPSPSTRRPPTAHAATAPPARADRSATPGSSRPACTHAAWPRSGSSPVGRWPTTGSRPS